MLNPSYPQYGKDLRVHDMGQACRLMQHLTCCLLCSRSLTLQIRIEPHYSATPDNLEDASHLFLVNTPRDATDLTMPKSSMHTDVYTRTQTSEEKVVNYVAKCEVVPTYCKKSRLRVPSFTWHHDTNTQVQIISPHGAVVAGRCLQG